ncbi:hypothetical protein [Burkholderia gladioli]|uniref:hypothetical protein n=1 Tax=Burkholderia gladioli TaxID=28095 RepID=UPI000F809E63|nr:hypothetical protein [Burkholderia gladioli]MBU9188576.1 hypothetical protein [Burkholderia gladioli]
MQIKRLRATPAKRTGTEGFHCLHSSDEIRKIAETPCYTGFPRISRNPERQSGSHLPPCQPSLTRNSPESIIKSSKAKQRIPPESKPTTKTVKCF